MASLVAALERDPADGAALQRLARHFHGLAGMGTTYGFPRVTVLGDEAEGAILPLVKHGGAPDMQLVARWKEIVGEMDQELVDEKPEPAAPFVFASKPAGGVRHRILVVEDDATTTVLYRGILGAAQYDVEICRDPVDFEKMLRAFVPDLVLMDVQLSGDVTGHDLVRLVRRDGRFSALPVIMVTSDSERRAMVESADAGADAILVKPIDPDLLLTEIARRLARTR